MNYKVFPFFLLMIFSLLSANLFLQPKNNIKSSHLIKVMKTNNPADDLDTIYKKLHSDKFSLPKEESFKEALKGFYRLKQSGVVRKNILTLIDFSMSSNTKRLWVIDLDSNTILFHSLVAHGKNTGNEFAENFSNAPESFKSSLGFFVTAEIYNGKHGKSLKLDGLEKGINDNARERAVVVHGANYVSNSFIQNNKRLGRSLGCPAIPLEITDELIKTIKDKSCLFIYYPSESYKRSSKLIS